MKELKFKKLDYVITKEDGTTERVISEGKLPTRATAGDAGLDLYSTRITQEVDNSGKLVLVYHTDIAVEIPQGYFGALVPRSSIAEKGLVIQTSIIDPDYTGEIHLIITNCSNNVIKIEKNQRVCSLVVYNVLNVRLDVVYDFEDTERGNNGLGSSGK